MNKSMYLITFDWFPGIDLLNDRLEDFFRQGKYWHYIDTTWIVITDMPLEGLNDRINEFINRSERRILIVDITQATQFNGFLPNEAWQWINKNQEELNGKEWLLKEADRRVEEAIKERDRTRSWFESIDSSKDKHGTA